MALKINYLDSQKGTLKNKALFVSKESKISDFKGILDDKTNQKILNFIKTNKKTQKNKIDSLTLEFNQKIIVILINEKTSSQEAEKLGAKFYDFVKINKIDDVLILGSISSSVKNKIKLDEFLHGAELKSYEFSLYKTKKNNKNIIFNILKSRNFINKNIKSKLNAVLSGINFTRDLVSEPGNILHPDEYAKRLIKLKKYGLKVTVYDQKKLKKLGCNALLGVGQGSIRGSYLVTIEWKEINQNQNL